MSIDKINPISRVNPVRPIPKEHWKWTGLDVPKREPKKQPEILEGELILYNRRGQLVVHNPSAEPDAAP